VWTKRSCAPQPHRRPSSGFSVGVLFAEFLKFLNLFDDRLQGLDREPASMNNMVQRSCASTRPTRSPLNNLHPPGRLKRDRTLGRVEAYDPLANRSKPRLVIFSQKLWKLGQTSGHRSPLIAGPMARVIIGAIDQEAANARCAHFSEAGVLRAGEGGHGLQ